VIYCSLTMNIGSIHKDPAHAAKDPVMVNTTVSDQPVFILPDVTLNPTALYYAKNYVKKNNWGLSQIKKKSKASLNMINSVFVKYNIPPELKYMAVVESNLNTALVCNSTGATGIWQLMPSTADELGLKVYPENDERLLVQKSSAAVAMYLKQLYEEFGDWLLVIAAYNSGPAKVSRAIQLSGSHDFWKLQNFLPLETRNHVKRFISVLCFFEMQNNLLNNIASA
jgi:membrane-bound lytic murein transglycosylase D